MILYHTTARTYRGSIRRHGLLARHPQNHPRGNYNNDHINLADQPVGVYGELTLIHARWWYRIHFAETGRDIWQIDAKGLLVWHDMQNQYNEGRVIPCNVSPERLTLVETFKPTTKGLVIYRDAHQAGTPVK